MQWIGIYILQLVQHTDNMHAHSPQGHLPSPVPSLWMTKFLDEMNVISDTLQICPWTDWKMHFVALSDHTEPGLPHLLAKCLSLKQVKGRFFFLLELLLLSQLSWRHGLLFVLISLPFNTCFNLLRIDPPSTKYGFAHVWESMLGHPRPLQSLSQ